MKRILGAMPGLFLLFGIVCNHALAQDEIVIPTHDDAEITATRFAAPGNYLVVWFEPEYGFRINHRNMASRFAQQGIEVWQPHVLESLFLVQGSDSIKKLNPEYIADVIDHAFKTTGKKILVSGDSYACLSALRGARAWQLRNQSNRQVSEIDRLVGGILFTPYTFAYIPPLGQSPEYMPIVTATNIPLMIYQSKNSGIVSQFPTLVSHLQENDNPVYTQYIPDVMSLFYQVPATPEMLAGADNIVGHIKKMISLLESHHVPATPVPLTAAAHPKSGIDVYLKEMTGNTKPLPINLPDTQGNTFKREQYRGKITLINFWATWCTPCIEEIPSLNRLQKKMRDTPFELISINYAEDKKYIDEFRKKISIEFPVLMDRDGAFAREWNVISYPSTFIIDSNGTIRYGVNAAINWDDPEVIKRLKSLL
jgi:thiol-disulfide isomerase/thioredoxin